MARYPPRLQQHSGCSAATSHASPVQHRRWSSAACVGQDWTPELQPVDGHGGMPRLLGVEPRRLAGPGPSPYSKSRRERPDSGPARDTHTHMQDSCRRQGTAFRARRPGADSVAKNIIISKSGPPATGAIPSSSRAFCCLPPLLRTYMYVSGHFLGRRICQLSQAGPAKRTSRRERRAKCRACKTCGCELPDAPLLCSHLPVRK